MRSAVTSIRRSLPIAAALVCALAATRPASGVSGPLPPSDPTEEEQHVIWELNKARRDPVAYGASIGLDLTGAAVQPPLAVNRTLTASSRFHAIEMYENDYFAHTSQVTGKGPNQMAVDHGYDVFGQGLSNAWGTTNNIESLARGMPDFTQALAALVIDAEFDPPGHRIHLLAMNPSFQKHREIGAGKAWGPRNGGTDTLYAIHTSYVNESDLFLTGVVYADWSGDGRFDVTEGMAGVSIDAVGDAGVFSTTSLSTGGWAIRVPAGDYSVQCHGGTFEGVAAATVTVTSANHEIDFQSGRKRGEVDFGTPLGPVVSLFQSTDEGLAALDVEYAATSLGPPAIFEWDFGDGGVAAGGVVRHIYAGPGAFVVRVKARDGFGASGALTAIGVDGPGIAGPGTFSPLSTALKVQTCKATSDFVRSGRDSIAFAAKMEMPGGWTRGLSPATVVAGGVKVAFPLVAGRDGFRDAAGNVFTLKYKHPRKGAPLGVGVKAQLTVKLRGDFRAIFDDLGVHDRTETPILAGVPIVVTLGEQCWTARVTLAVRSTAGASAVATLRR